MISKRSIVNGIIKEFTVNGVSKYSKKKLSEINLALVPPAGRFSQFAELPLVILPHPIIVIILFP